MTQAALAAKLQAACPPDFIATYNGSTCSLEPLTDAGRDWIDENLETEGWQWLGRRLIIDTRYFNDILHGIVADGLQV